MAFYSSGVEYGVHSLMCMVDANGQPCEMSVRELAELLGIPYDYLAKIFTRLARAGLVASSEGKGGGFALAREAGLITVLDVARAIDGNKPLFECREIRQRMALFDKSVPLWACSGSCGVREVMDNAQRQMEENLSRTTVLDLTRLMMRKAPETFNIEIKRWIARRRDGDRPITGSGQKDLK